MSSSLRRVFNERAWEAVTLQGLALAFSGPERRTVLLFVVTGLPNRALFLDRLGYALDRLNRTAAGVSAVFFLDLDQFKVVNDSLGHLVGDRLLVATAERLGGIMRTPDTLARFGGDEFAVLVEDIDDVTIAMQIAERIHEVLAVPFMLEEHQVVVTASIGIAMTLTGEGTGYASLSYLQQLPVTHIKIDRAFMHDMTTNANNATLVRTMITMAYGLNLRTIAEGVETDDQRNLLHAYGCDACQGYLVSRPLPAETLLPRLQQGQ